MKSMTGYGRGEASRQAYQDHRRTQFGEPKAGRNREMSLPREMEVLEPRLREEINQRVSRGRLTARAVLQAGGSELPPLRAARWTKRWPRPT